MAPNQARSFDQSKSTHLSTNGGFLPWLAVRLRMRKGLGEMTADNRTNEQRRLKSCVEAWPECATGDYNPACCRFPKSCSATVYSEEHVTEDDLEPRAALVAAQVAARPVNGFDTTAERVQNGADSLHVTPVLPSSTAPQAESADCDRDRMGICKRCGMGWDARKVLDGDFACPVLPSSGVDEDKLAEVIARVTDLWDDPLDEVHDIPQIARAVAKWFEEQ